MSKDSFQGDFGKQFMGGSIASSQVWLKSHGKLILEQLDNPFEKEGVHHE